MKKHSQRSLLELLFTKERNAKITDRKERFIFFNIKAGLQSGIPLCCIMHHTFTYNVKYHKIYKNNREALDRYIKLRDLIDEYHEVYPDYVRCPKCLLNGRFVKILIDKPNSSCADTSWLKAISTFIFKRDDGK